MRSSTRGGVRKWNAGAGEEVRQEMDTTLRNARSDDALAAMSRATRRTPAEDS